MAALLPDIHHRFISRAIEIAYANVASGDGGPFGALIVRGDAVVAESTNHVLVSNDPTAHAEIEAIRTACRVLGTYELRDCVLYASCEPCPMCLGAIYWSHIAQVYFAATRADAREFDDAHIYNELALPLERRSIPMMSIDHELARTPFTAWAKKVDRGKY